VRPGSASPRDVVQSLHAKGLTLATAESCTGGLLAAALTSIPGSSAVFKGGFVAYADEAKRSLLGVPAEVLQQDGAVSKECAAAMAREACQRLGSDLAVSITGIAGPGGAVPGKPVGTVWFAVATRAGEVHARTTLFPGGRDEVRSAAVDQALRLVLEKIAARPGP
jgi:nicotinamide-nucleotide amidase